MLTTEQKINLLILAGYAPWLMSKDARILNPSGECLHYGGGVWYFHDNWGHADYYTKGDWGKLPIDSIPDELIYEACHADD